MIKNINIIKFRGIENKKIELGERVTILAGKNGTQKSTILGLLGQPFAFYGSKDGVKQELEKGILNENDILTILGHPFETKFSELFKFSPKYELEKEYRYILEFKDGYFEMICTLSSAQLNY